MYEVDGYEHNITPVIFLGDWQLNNYVPKIGNEYRPLASFRGSAITYRQILLTFSRYLGEDLQLVSDTALIKRFNARQEVKEMPKFPKKGYCQMIDGYLVINF